MKQGAIVLKGDVELISPALIGSGEDDFTHMDVLLDGEGRPIIPATSIIGVLKNYTRCIQDEFEKDRFDSFWGFSIKKDSQRSKIFCSDMKCDSDSKVMVRDGIRIDRKTGMVEQGAKYDYQLIERGAQFRLNMEISIYDKKDWDFFRKMMITIRKILEDEKILIGAKTNNGFGRLKLKKSEVYDFNFEKIDDVISWLKKDFSGKQEFSDDVVPYNITKKDFIIDATFKIKNSFVIKSYSEKAEEPDAVSIKSNDKFIITGSSLKGGIRSRAEKILITLEKPQSLIEDLFGFVKSEDSSQEQKAKKGRFQIEEVLLSDYVPELQTRIKIDRFTGGVMRGALFETIAVFNGEKEHDEKSFKVKMIIKDYRKEEAGLILLVLKDLWIGDLAIGGEKNIGRGVLKGIEADIKWDDERIILNDEMIKSRDLRKEKLNEFVSFLLNG